MNFYKDLIKEYLNYECPFEGIKKEKKEKKDVPDWKQFEIDFKNLIEIEYHDEFYNYIKEKFNIIPCNKEGNINNKIFHLFYCGHYNNARHFTFGEYQNNIWNFNLKYNKSQGNTLADYHLKFYYKEYENDLNIKLTEIPISLKYGNSFNYLNLDFENLERNFNEKYNLKRDYRLTETFVNCKIEKNITKLYEFFGFDYKLIIVYMKCFLKYYCIKNELTQEVEEYLYKKKFKRNYQNVTRNGDYGIIDYYVNNINNNGQFAKDLKAVHKFIKNDNTLSKINKDFLLYFINLSVGNDYLTCIKDLNGTLKFKYINKNVNYFTEIKNFDDKNEYKIIYGKTDFSGKQFYLCFKAVTYDGGLEDIKIRLAKRYHTKYDFLNLNNYKNEKRFFMDLKNSLPNSVCVGTTILEYGKTFDIQTKQSK